MSKLEPNSKTILSAFEARFGRFGVAIELRRRDRDSAEKMGESGRSGAASSSRLRWEDGIARRLATRASRGAVVVAGGLIMLLEAFYSERLLRESTDGQEGCVRIPGQVHEQRR